MYYAVKCGFHPRVYDSWIACEIEVKGLRGTKFKAFRNRLDVENYILS